ncbi:hypothetical protein OsI_19882 [Oryza sativa Indica Group]|uniref:Uncharacterized protein n=1 Tax=Oryza sativa subsp. indica TaxID=39946 RepID=B8AY18_ORYSI|nr:hypothetical protein OsI_19882 [Oryza sativa Indica Group]
MLSPQIRWRGPDLAWGKPDAQSRGVGCPPQLGLRRRHHHQAPPPPPLSPATSPHPAASTATVPCHHLPPRLQHHWISRAPRHAHRRRSRRPAAATAYASPSAAVAALSTPSVAVAALASPSVAVATAFRRKPPRRRPPPPAGRSHPGGLDPPPEWPDLSSPPPTVAVAASCQERHAPPDLAAIGPEPPRRSRIHRIRPRWRRTLSPPSASLRSRRCPSCASFSREGEGPAAAVLAAARLCRRLLGQRRGGGEEEKFVAARAVSPPVSPWGERRGRWGIPDCNNNSIPLCCCNGVCASVPCAS